MEGQDQDIVRLQVAQIQSTTESAQHSAQQSAQHLADSAQHSADSAQQSAAGLTDQVSNFLHQTEEQVKNMAQGAAEAVKHALGMDTDDNSSNNNTTNAINSEEATSLPGHTNAVV